MTSRSRRTLASPLVGLLGAALLVFPTSACSDSEADPGPAERGPTSRPAAESGSGGMEPLADRALAPFQDELLGLAFQTAAAIPVDPHVKTRSRRQEEVVAACLELDQPVRALGWIRKMDGWRRGTAYAALAAYCAKRRHVAEAERYLQSAGRVADEVLRDPHYQAWRRDRILIGIAKTHLLLGQDQRAGRTAKGVVPAESGEVDVVRADLIDGEAFDHMVHGLDAVLKTGSFDVVRNAVRTCARLFDRFYEDESRRRMMEQRIRSAAEKVPADIRIDLLAELAASALDHGDRDKALELVADARALIDANTWLAEHEVPLVARVAALRHRCGDVGRALEEAAEARATYDEKRGTIVDIFRAETLLSLAEAYAAMGEDAAALALYKRAVEEGVLNPNSRPRAEDLTSVCLSMAVHEVEPDPKLMARIRELHEGLDHPW